MLTEFHVTLHNWPELTDDQRNAAQTRFYDSLVNHFGTPRDVIEAWSTWYDSPAIIGLRGKSKASWPEAEDAARAAAINGLLNPPMDLSFWCTFFEGAYLHPVEIAAMRKVPAAVIWPEPAEPAPF